MRLQVFAFLQECQLYHFLFSYSLQQTIRTLPKRSVLYVPGFGQLLWALECPFLTRNFAKDETTIKMTSEVYKSYPFPIQVGESSLASHTLVVRLGELYIPFPYRLVRVVSLATPW